MAGEHGDNSPHSVSLLDWIISSRRRLSEREVRPLAQQLARTLSLIHEHGVVHRSTVSSLLPQGHADKPYINRTITDLKLENIHVRVDHTATARKARLGRRAIITDFTFAAVTAVPAADSDSAALLMARCGQQYSPAPELLRGIHTTQLGAQAEIPSYYAGPPVDVWGFGVVLHTLICGRVPFDESTAEGMHQASLCSPAGLHFPKRVSRGVLLFLCARGVSALFIICLSHLHSHIHTRCLSLERKGCRDLLQRMLQADPTARASLDEVLKHPWMLLLGADSDVPKHAALKWPDQVDRKWFDRVAALESRNGDDAWRSLAQALDLVSHLCEPCSCSSGDSRAHTRSCTTSHMSRLPQGIRELPDRALSLLAKIRSHAVLQVSLSRKRRTKIVTQYSHSMVSHR